MIKKTKYHYFLYIRLSKAFERFFQNQYICKYRVFKIMKALSPLLKLIGYNNLIKLHDKIFWPNLKTGQGAAFTAYWLKP